MKPISMLRGLLFTAGVLLMSAYLLARVSGWAMARVSLWAFENAQTSTSEKASSPIRSEQHRGVNFGLWSEERIRAYKATLGLKVDPPLGVLTVPKAKIEVPILDGTDTLELNRGVGWIHGTAPPGEAGNTAIAGHRDGFFRGLKELANGDEVELTTPQGVFHYTIDAIEIVDPSDTSVLGTRSRPSLTLVTCYPFYFLGSAPKRYIVHASLVGSGSANSESSPSIRQVKQEHTR